MASLKSCLLFGASGRLGQILESRLLSYGFIVIKVPRDWHENQIMEVLNKFNASEYSGEVIGFCDCSIDYRSSKLFLEHERFKSGVIERMHLNGLLGFYLGFSSGVVEFDDSLIMDSFKLDYKKEKLSRLQMLKRLGIPYYFPKIFTVIGKVAYKTKSTGWASVVYKCINENSVYISDSYELRSWIAEEKIAASIDMYLDNPTTKVEGVLTSGIFSLGEIVGVCEAILAKRIRINKVGSNRWLKCAYVNQFADFEINDELSKNKSLKDIIEKIVFN